MKKEMFAILLTIDVLLIVALWAGRMPVRGDIRPEGWVFREKDPKLFWGLWGFTSGWLALLTAVPLIRGNLL